MKHYEKFERWSAMDTPMSALEPSHKLHIYLSGLKFHEQISLLDDMLQVCRKWTTAEAKANLESLWHDSTVFLDDNGEECHADQ